MFTEVDFIIVENPTYRRRGDARHADGVRLKIGDLNWWAAEVWFDRDAKPTSWTAGRVNHERLRSGLKRRASIYIERDKPEPKLAEIFFRVLQTAVDDCFDY
jgi:hypothetical protein